MRLQKWIKCCLLLAIVLTVTAFFLPTRAEAATEGDYTYEVTNSEATITGYTGAGDNITIPATLGGYPVTTIGGYAFEWRGSLTEVTIPDSVTTIGEHAFECCGSLTEVSIPDSVTTIGNCAFYFCGLTDINIPDSVTTIGDYAFCLCESLAGVTIPDSVTTIGYRAFSECNNLISVTIPGSVTTIGNGAFSDCDRLTGIWVEGNNCNYSSDTYGVLFNKDKTLLVQAPVLLSCSYTIPNSVTSIGVWAFSGCDTLTGITIPDSVTTISDNAFSYCDSLTNITIPNSVTSIGTWAFNDCTNLSEIVYLGTKCQWEKVELGTENEDLLNANWTFNEGEHSFTNYVSNNDATCTKNGTETAKCDRCTATKTRTDTNSAKGYTYKAKVTKPTCLKKGYTTYTCACGDTYTANKVSALGHKYAKGSCTHCGDKPAGVKVSKQPVNAVAANGATAKVTVSAAGEGLTYKWYYKNKGASKFSLSSVKTSTYKVAMKSAVNGRQVYCKVTDKFGNTVTTKTVTLKRK